MAGRSPRSAFRWSGFEFSLRSSIFRWTGVLSSFFARDWRSGWVLRWPQGLLSISIVDELVWSVMTAFESVALVSMIGFFFVFYGCNLRFAHDTNFLAGWRSIQRPAIDFTSHLWLAPRRQRRQ